MGGSGQNRKAIDLYACRARTDVDTAKLGYFALSVLWKACAHVWTTPYGASTPLCLGPYEETLRKYLVGESPFPDKVALLVTVCTDIFSQQILYDPHPRKTTSYQPYRIYDFLVCGIHFRISMGSRIPIEFRELCCVRGAAQWIVVEDREDGTVALYAGMSSKSKIAMGLTDK
jgi:hypothetical protein